MLEIPRASFRSRDNKDGTVRMEAYLDLSTMQADTTWQAGVSSDRRAKWPPVKVQMAGPLRELGGRPRALSAEDFGRTILVRKMEGDMTRLESLNKPQAGAPTWATKQEAAPPLPPTRRKPDGQTLPRREQGPLQAAQANSRGACATLFPRTRRTQTRNSAYLHLLRWPAKSDSFSGKSLIVPSSFLRQFGLSRSVPGRFTAVSSPTRSSICAMEISEDARPRRRWAAAVTETSSVPFKSVFAGSCSRAIRRSKACLSLARLSNAVSASSADRMPSASFSRMSSPCHQPASVDRSCVERQASDFFG